MIEILFSDSACGSLKMAQHYGNGNYLGGCEGVTINHPDGSNPTKEEIKAAQQEAKEKLCIEWGNTIPMDGNSADIFGFPLALSIGSIAGEDTLAGRVRVLERLYNVYSNGEERQAALEIINAAKKSLEMLYQRIKLGEAVRIWYSNQPDEMCGLYWFISQLKLWKIDNIQIFAVKLPLWEEDGENIIQKSGWNEVTPKEWNRYLKLQKPISTALIRSYAFCWQILQNEDAPLRAVLNGKLVSVSDTLYDNFILNEIAAECDEFHEVNVIGRVLGKYQLGIGDAWVALRIEEMIVAGKIKVISAAPNNRPGYNRILKKCR